MNNYAISTADLAQSLTKSSASLVAAGGDLAEAAALTATANKIIQDADSVGTALKTTSLRLRGTDVKVLEEEGLDSEGAVTSKSKLQGKVKALSGVDILTATGAYKSTYEILRDIAEVWESMNDMDQAALLELISGKRNSSVVAAILQNPEELKAVFEDANNAQGSALKENEKYLDSIQGKIDQFNNAVQTLWSNTLDSDFIKLIVEIGTEIVKLIDKMGSLNFVVAGLFAYLNRSGDLVDFSKLFSGFKEAFSSSSGPKEFFKNLKNGFKNTGISIDQAKAKLAELEAQRRELGSPASERGRQRVDALDQEINKYKEMLKPHEDFVAAQKKLEAAQNRLTNASGKSLKPETIKKYQREVDKARANVDNLAGAQQRAGTTGQSAFKKLGKGVKAFGKQVASIVTQMLVMWAITKVIELVSNGLGNLVTTAEEAADKYEELNGELDDLKDKLKDIEGELDAIDDQMAELIAKGSLTFVEQEELDRLREEREGLERTLELNQQLQKQKQQQINNQTSDQVEYYKNKGVNSGKTTGEITTTGAIVGGAVGVGATAAFGAKLGTAIGTAIAPGVGSAVGAVLGIVVGGIVGAVAGGGIGDAVGASEEKVGESIENMEEKLAEKEEEVRKTREKYQKTGKDSDKEKYEEAQKALSDYRGEMAQYFTEIDAMYQNVDLSTIEDPDEYKRLKEEMNDFYNERDKWLVSSGAEGAGSNAIERIFSKDDYKNASDTIDTLVKKLEKDPTDQNIISQISEQCKIAEKDLEAVGLSVQDAKDYFTMLGQNMAFDTIEGKTAEIASVTSKLRALLSNTKSSDFTGLFGQGGEVSKTAIAEYFKGTSDATREEIARLVKNIHDGEITVQQAMKSFAAFGMLESWEIIETQISELNTDVFKDLGDEISGIINTVGELRSAFESVADSIKLIGQAEAEMAYSGHLSVETALHLMESTEDWNKVLKIEEGNIKLVEGAEDALVQTKLDLIKTNLQTALSTVEAQLAQLDATASSADMAYTIEESTNLAVTELAGNMAYLTEMMTAYTKAAAGEDVDMSAVTAAAEAAKNKVKEATNYQKNAAEAIGREDLEKEKARLEAMLGMLGTVDTPSEFKSNYSSDEVSGGNADKDGAEDDLFQKEMDYWENRIAANQAKYEQLQNEIDLMEAKGQKADASFYEEQIDLENKRLWLLGEQKKAAQAHLATLEEGSEKWWEVASTLNDLEGELDDVTASIVDLQDAIAEIDTYKFEEFNNRLDNLTSKLETIRNLVAPDGEEDWFDDNGDWTESGVAVLGSRIQELEMYKQGYQETMDELANYEPAYDGNEAYYEALGIHSEQEYYDKTQELINQQYDFAESISNTEQSIADMYESNIDAVEEYTQTLVDSYNDYIDNVKEALDAERNLYNFKKNVQKQTKDIAALERRIASLSGSTNASDIAERRRLEADLYGAREELDDTYYEHARDTQSEALDKEAEAYEESMNNFIEGLRTGLDEATRNMDEFLMGVTSMVMYNADTVLTKYEETNLPLTKELTNPWEEAKKATSSYSGNAIDLMNQWTKEGGFFAQFNSTGTTNLKSPWSAGTTAANSFKTSVSTVMSGVVSNIATNVKTASGELSKLYQQIQDTEKRASDANVVISGSGAGGSGGSGGYVAPQKKYYVTAFLDMGSRSLSVTKSDADASKAMSAAKIAILGEYEKVKGNSISAESAWQRTWRNKVKYTTQYYAKGTFGTKRDEWAITDEPQFGEELVLVPGKDGNLSFVRKGTGIVPADMTQKLFELAQIPMSDLMNKNLTAIVPNITKNDFKNEFNFESLVHVDTVDSDTLPKLEKMVDKKIDDFSRALNYSLKRFAR